MDPSLVRQFIDLKILQFGEFTLASGDTSPYYLDLRLIPSYPSFFKTIISMLKEKTHSIGPFDALAGIATAGIPFASVLGYEMGLPVYIVRKEAKQYGLKKQIEGAVQPHGRVLLLDDVVSTGASKIPAIKAVRSADLVVNDMLVIVDRSHKRLSSLWQELDISLHSLIQSEQLLKTALEAELVPSHLVERIEALL